MYFESERQRAEAEAREYVACIAAAARAVRDRDGADALRQLDAAPQAHRGWEWDHLSKMYLCA